jgi:hypothetical protein
VMGYEGHIAAAVVGAIVLLVFPKSRGIFTIIGIFIKSALEVSPPHRNSGRIGGGQKSDRSPVEKGAVRGPACIEHECYVCRIH